MRLFGLSLNRAERTKEAVPAVSQPLNRASSWFPVIREPFTGAWQRNIQYDAQSVLSFHAVFACVTLISSDIAKLRLKLVERDASGIWSEVERAAFSPVLRKPNHYQNRIQFWEHWILSKLTRGNTYVLKERDGRNVVTALYILDPDRVRPLIAADGSVFYEVQPDPWGNPTGAAVTIPAREIIHDRMHAGLYHPLCGVSPLTAAGLAATQGLRIQGNSARFFGNNAQPGGVLTSEHIKVSDGPALTEQWRQNYGGENYGNVAVLAGGLKYQQLTMSAQDAQLIDQLRWSAEVVCGVMHVPQHKLGIGPAPLNNNVQAFNLEYYSQCIQKQLEDVELCMDEGLGIGEGVGPEPYIGTEFDVDNLLRMDTQALVAALKDGVSAAIYAPNEARLKVNLPPVDGGDVPFLQEQNWPVTILAAREMPTAPPTAPVPTKPAPGEAAPAPNPPPADTARRDLAERVARIVEISHAA
jgi:HK97 family phage portal protein